MIEYKRVAKNIPGISMEELNEFGKENWELCGSETQQDYKTIIPFEPPRLVDTGKIYIFKRSSIFEREKIMKVVVTCRANNEYITATTNVESKFNSQKEENEFYRKVRYAIIFLKLFHWKPGIYWNSLMTESDADWIDEYCDLTLDEFIKVSSIDKQKLMIDEKIKLS